MASPTFGVQAAPTAQRSWTEEAKRAEDLGFTFFCIGDHPGSWPSPFAALGAAASVTSSILLGPYVANAGLRDPLDLATDTATLDIVSDGRAVLGLGAGHTPIEWAMRALARPAPGDRVDRLIAVADATQSLLRGETVSMDGLVRLAEAKLADRLVRPEIPLLIGGNNRRLLSFAAERADIIGTTGLGRTLEGGHLHEARWSEHELEKTFRLASSNSDDRATEIQALVQWAEITNDPESIARRVSEDLGVSVGHVLAAPFVLLGTAHQIAERVAENFDRWGINSYVVRSSSTRDIARVIELIG